MTDEKLLPIKALSRITSAIVRDNPNKAVAYEYTNGNPELRRQIAFRSIDAGVSLNPEQIVVTNGCMEALHLALRACTRSGDNVLVQTPTFHCLLELMESLGLRAIEVPSDPETGISVKDVENAIKRFNIRVCMLTLNFNNPDGSLVPEEAKADLVGLLSKHEIPLIEDDVYGDLYFGERRPSWALKYDKKGLVMLCSSFSKTLAPGYRLGWIVPGRQYEKVMGVKTTSTLSNSSLPQMVGAEYLKTGQYDRLLKRLRTAIQHQVQSLQHNIRRYFPDGTRVSRPQGGSHLWLELPEYVDSIELFYQAKSL